MMSKKNVIEQSCDAQDSIGGNTPDRAWCYGYKAAQGGLLEESNPFHLHSENYSLWIEGWWVGFYA